MHTPERDVVGWLGGFAASTQRHEQIEHLVRLVDDEITAAIPDLGADEGLRHDLHASTRAHWRGFLAMLGRSTFAVHPPIEAFDLARTIARRGLELGVLLKIYRVGQRALWHYITKALDDQIADSALRSAVLVAFWGRASEWLDSTVEVLVVAYSEEREQWRRGALARRASTVHAILRGEPVDLDESATLLGHALRQHQTAFVLWADESTAEPEVMRALEGRAGELAAALGGARPLLLTSGARGLWGWVATAVPPDLDTLASTGRCTVSAAVGTPAPGLAGFRRSHAEALAAQRVAINGPHDPPVVRYPDVELVCLTTGDGSIEAVRAMAERELGALAARDGATARLRETARVFLAGGGNTHTAAAELGVHPNTVRYRIHQVEALLGHPIDQRRTHIELALRCAHVYGDVILPPTQSSS